MANKTWDKFWRMGLIFDFMSFILILVLMLTSSSANNFVLGNPLSSYIAGGIFIFILGGIVGIIKK